MKQNEDDWLEYDDDAAVDYILDFLPDDAKERVDEETVNYVLDVIYDYYDSKGYIEEDSAEEASIDEEEMFNFICDAARKDGVALSEDDLQLILEGEYEYGVSIGVYEDNEY